jgi:hypothetical protein
MGVAKLKMAGTNLSVKRVETRIIGATVLHIPNQTFAQV